MVSKKKPNYSAQVKFWVDGVIGEINGGIPGCVNGMFMSLPREKRERTLQRLTDTHDRLCASESKALAIATQKTS